MQRIHIKNLDINFKNLELNSKELVNQLWVVLKLKEKDNIVLFNWEDEIDYIYEIISINKKRIIVEYNKKIIKNNELDFSINLFQAIPNKQEKIEYIIQKWTEIWISNFYFFKSERSQKFNLTKNKEDRFKKIIIEAVEQSNRNIIPDIIFLDSLNLDYFSDYENFFFHTDKDNSFLLKDLKINYNSWVNLFIWPEWGFTDSEEKNFWLNNFRKIYLWNRILRTETAWITSSFYIIQNK